MECWHVSGYKNHLKQSGMKRSYFILALSAMIITSVSVQAQRAKTVRGEGDVVVQERSVGSFNEIHTHGSFNVNITDAATNGVKVEAQQNLQEYIDIETKGNELHIRNKKGYDLRPTREITINISAPALTVIRCSGSGNIKSTNTLNGSDKLDVTSAGSGNINLDVETSKLKTSIAGSGNITLKGKTSDLEGSIAGSGNIKAKEMQSANTSVRISGSGNAEVVATQKLTSSIAGSGDVKYWGNASVDSKVMGSGSIRKQN